MDDSWGNQVRHLYDVEGLSIRQIAAQLGLSRKKVSRLIEKGSVIRKKRASIIDPYGRLIQDWYETYPSLKATQVFDRLQTYGFTGRYTTVKEYTRSFRRKRKRMYHELSFLPGEEAQVDWMQRAFPFGVAYGFVFILSYSRYLYARFYPRQTMEFFLEGHIEAYKEIGGVPHRGRYDNLKLVVIKRHVCPAHVPCLGKYRPGPVKVPSARMEDCDHGIVLRLIPPAPGVEHLSGFFLPEDAFGLAGPKNVGGLNRLLVQLREITFHRTLLNYRRLEPTARKLLQN